MRGVQTIDFDPDNVSAAGIASELDVEAIGVLVITALADADGVGRQILFDDETVEGGDNASVTIVITGTDADGRAQNETITGLNDAGDTKTSVKYYNTVSDITLGGTLTAAMDLHIGTNGVACSRSIGLDKYAINSPAVQQDLTGTATWDIETTVENINDPTTVENQGDVTWTVDANFDDVAADAIDNLDVWPVYFARLLTSAYTDTGEIKVTFSQGY